MLSAPIDCRERHADGLLLSLACRQCSEGLVEDGLQRVHGAGEVRDRVSEPIGHGDELAELSGVGGRGDVHYGLDIVRVGLDTIGADAETTPLNLVF